MIESNQNKIAFLGASVTAQTFSWDTGELVGYVEEFKVSCQSYFGFSEAKAFAYPGNRLSDAGILKLQELIDFAPKIAVIEPVVESEAIGLGFDERHLSHVYFSLLENKILPITVAFPKQQKRNPFELNNYVLVKNFCDRYNFPLLAAVIPEHIALADIYRDGVHTNNSGAKLYCKFVKEAVEQFACWNLGVIRFPKHLFKFHISEVGQSPVVDLIGMTIENSSYSYESCYLDVIQLHQIGRYSPVVESKFIKDDKCSNLSRVSFWDPHCHRKRNSYVKLIEARGNASVFDQVRIEVSSKLPDYSKCRRSSDYTNDKNLRFLRPLSSAFSISDQPVALRVCQTYPLYSNMASVIEKQLFLHIGMKKAASTTIQIFLENNLDVLEHKGYFFPWTSRMQHRELSFASKRQPNDNLSDKDSAMWLEFHSLISSSHCKNVIVSSEAFESFSPKYIQSLKARLSHYRTKVVVYIRRQDLRLESHYFQDIKSGVFTGSIEDYQQEYMYETLDYFHYLEAWSDVFGRENMIVRVLEKSQSPDVCSDFLEAVGLGHEYKDFQKLESNKNLKPNLAQMSAIKLINDSVASTYDKTNKGFSRLDLKFDFNRKYSIPFFRISKNWDSSRRYRVLSYEASKEILSKFEESNKKVAKLYFNRSEGTLFYDQLELKYNSDNIEASNLDQQKLVSVCSFLQRTG